MTPDPIFRQAPRRYMTRVIRRSAAVEPSRSRTVGSSPHSTGAGIPGGAMNLDTSADIWPMKPVLVQLAIAMIPPGRQLPRG